MPTPQFEAHIADLINQSRLQGAAACVPGVVRRPWNIPSTAPVGTDIENPQFFIAACNRAELNNLATSAYASGDSPNGGRCGQIMATKKAMDYQAAYERALHARFASAVRRRVWAMSRRTGHGSTYYGVYNVVKNEIANIYNSATAEPNAAT